MGRYNFRPQRVHDAVTGFLEAQRIDRKPAWYDVVGGIPPPEILTRKRPVQHARTSRGPPPKKASKLFRPTEIQYPEDELRRTFFKDHPWELARPRIVTESDGINGTETWDTIRPRGHALTGENVVQRQMYLMNHHNLSKTQAYDVARSEFYEQRLKEDIARRVAKEEASHYGAYFGKSRLEVGYELENKAYENWKVWADKEVTEVEQQRIAGSAGPSRGIQSSEEVSEDLSEEEVGALPTTAETLRP